MEKSCIACGGQLESGSLRARSMGDTVHAGPQMGVVVKTFAFVRPGVPTSGNPVKAFVQGLHDEPDDQPLTLQAFRCVGCGRVELYAPEG
jgi:hypothetical protein